MVKRVYQYHKSVSKKYSNTIVQMLKIIGIGSIITILLSIIGLENILIILIPIIISVIIAFIFLIVNLIDVESANYIFAVDDTQKVYIINPIGSGLKSSRARVSNLNENSNEISFIENIISKAKEYFPQIKNGILKNPDYSNPYIVKEILKVHSFHENDKAVILKCDYTIINGTPENNKILEIAKSYNNWNELYEIIKTTKM